MDTTLTVDLDLLTMTEAAAYLGIKRKILHNWTWNKFFTPNFVEADGVFMYDKADLDRYLKRRPGPKESSGLLNEGQAAIYLGVPSSKLLRWRCYKLYTPKFIKKKKSIMFERKELDDFLKLGPISDDLINRAKGLA